MKRKGFDFTLARSVHNSFYTYDKVVCVGVKKKVIITCPKHGDFLQMPYSHIIKKQGCRWCQYESYRAKFTFTKEMFIDNANKIHNGKYNYEESDYIDSQTKIKIRCNLHGIFTQLPLNHVNKGKGCPACKFKKLSELYTLSTIDFIDMAKKIHGKKYGYSNVNYRGMKYDVKIICKKHGMFNQRASNHIHLKNGCPGCGYNVSVKEKEWLNSLGIPKKWRQRAITVNKRRFKFDAYDENLKTVYEFFGYFWHGHPDHFNSDDINPKTENPSENCIKKL
jgi:hypothetical protein